MEKQSSPSIAVLLIGNEILSGQVEDLNLSHIARKLEAQGLQISECRVVPDVMEDIIEAVNALRERYTYVITTGGIGPTHDDITAQAMGEAFGQEMELHPEAVACFQRDHQEGTPPPLTPAQTYMATLPKNATIVLNPESRAPGFRVENVFCLAGFPHIMQSMLVYVLKEIGEGTPIYTEKLHFEGHEGLIGGVMADLQKAHPSVAIGSYPQYNGDHYTVQIVMKGRDKPEVNKVLTSLKAYIKENFS